MSTVPQRLLSPAAYLAQERGAAFKSHYRRLPSLRGYVLVAQDRPQVESYVRQPDDSWLLREVSQLDQTVAVGSVSVQLPMSEIYRQVTWAGAAPAPAES